MQRKLLITAAVLAAFCIGVYAGKLWESRRGTFHDMIVNHPDDIRALITPNDSRVKKLAADLQTPQNAFLHVRDRIGFDPSLPSGSAGEVIAEGRASCLGKAVLLCSLYRAMGIPASDVRVVTGELAYPDAVIDHTWVDMEYEGTCYQQDTTDLLGNFRFDQFKGMEYVRTYVRKEGYAFNDVDFVIISRLNLMKVLGHPQMQ